MTISSLFPASTVNTCSKESPLDVECESCCSVILASLDSFNAACWYSEHVTLFDEKSWSSRPCDICSQDGRKQFLEKILRIAAVLFVAVRKALVSHMRSMSKTVDRQLAQQRSLRSMIVNISNRAVREDKSGFVHCSDHTTHHPVLKFWCLPHVSKQPGKERNSST